MMKEKYYDSTSSLVMGIIFLVLGFTFLIGKERLYQYMIAVVVFVFWGISLMNMIRFFFRHDSVKKREQIFLSCLFHFSVCLVFVGIPNLFYGVIPLIFSFYLLVIGIAQFVMCLISIGNGEFIRVSQFFMGLIYFGIGIPILKSPITRLDSFVICFSIYVILLGIYYLYDFVSQVLSVKVKNRVKRRIRITLPKIVEAVIPYSVMLEINRNLEVSKKDGYSFFKDDRECDLHILVHTSNRGVNRIGHIDIAFQGKVISYGNYDEGSRKCCELFGDGVLFVLDDKSKYIDFCIDNSKKTIFDFGIVLTDRQKARVKRRIEELFDNTCSWDYRDDNNYNGGSSYAAKLYKRTGAKFYKFKKGKYRTFFVLGTNCSFLADDIIGYSGMDILSINGIITPGTYYDYLNRELRLKNSNVISKDIYNFDRRAGK